MRFTLLQFLGLGLNALLTLEQLDVLCRRTLGRVLNETKKCVKELLAAVPSDGMCLFAQSKRFFLRES